jgi:hypothetical protein
LTTYFWRVAAYNEYGKCEWSDVWKFTTKDPTSVDDKDFKLLSLTAQPNPFSTDITFIINSPVFNMANIEIYNSLGKIVDVIENVNINQGINSIYWDPMQLESGIYNVVYKSSAGTVTLKAVFIK